MQSRSVRSRRRRSRIVGGDHTGRSGQFQSDPHWRDCLQFFEYFHGDSGAGLGASHQTGWTGVIARLMHVFATVTAEEMLEGGKKAYFQKQNETPWKQPEPNRSAPTASR